MSKAFTKDDSSNDLVIVPERAPLPPGVPNYVTERGLRLLEEEQRELIAERSRLQAEAHGDEAEHPSEHQKRLAFVGKRLRDLTERIATARTVAPPSGTDRTVRFGATVTVKTIAGDNAGESRCIKLVGVDEAGESADLVAFCAPIAKAILGHGPGERVTRPARGGDEVLQIVNVSYDAPGG